MCRCGYTPTARRGLYETVAALVNSGHVTVPLGDAMVNGDASSSKMEKLVEMFEVLADDTPRRRIGEEEGVGYIARQSGGLVRGPVKDVR